MPSYMNLLFAQTAAPDNASIPWYVNLLLAVGVVAISFFLGGYLGKKLRMYDHGWKIGLCLFSLLASVLILATGPAFKLGVDLSGGAILVYEVDKSKQTTDTPVDMDKLIASISRRVNPGGQKEVTIRKYGDEQVEIIVPEKERSEVDRIKRTISRAGNLEFRILANNRNDRDVIEQAKAEPSRMTIFDADGKTPLAWWVPVKTGEAKSFNYPEIAQRTRKIGDREVTEILVVKDIYNVTGAYLTRADVGSDRKGQPCVNFQFNSEGGQLFGELTGANLPDKVTDFTYKLGIILDGELYSAPSIQSTIFDRGEITGSFTKEEVQELVNVLNAGSLPAALSKEPISELFSGPTLGQDTIEKSWKAMMISSILVPLFMLWYYRFSGLVADIVLVLNMLMLFAIILTVKAALTLTGFAGLALTVGMAVDNNVLIYERLREELERGATLRMAIRNAFQRASATIIDANLTTLIAATVLYVIGSDQIKGFAVVLWLGVAISIFTSVFVSRVIFDIAEKRQWITRVKMLRLIGHTNIDFLAIFRYTLTASIVITVLAIAVAFYRGKGLFDIDFTGGVSVQALFDKPQDTGDVREQLTGKLDDLAVSDVRIGNEQQGLRFVINTSDPNLGHVKTVLSKVFGDTLARNTVTVGEVKLIEAAKEPAAKPAEPGKKDQSRRDLPSNRMLAFAGDEAMALALADEAPKAVAEKPAAEKAVEEAAPAQPVEVPQAKPAPRKPSPNEKIEAGQGTAPAKPAPLGPDPYAGKSITQLKFTTPLNYADVKQLIESAIEALQLDLRSTPFRLTREGYVEGDNTAHAEWDLSIMLTPDEAKPVLAKLEEQVNGSPIFPASSEIGAAVAGNIRVQAMLALVASWVCMIIYLWVRFQNVAFGLAAVVALIHDVFVMLGAIAVSIYVAPYLGFLMIEPFKINLAIVAAFLTIIGYSVNDTIVIFDRIREVRGKDPNMTVKMINDSTNQTMSRSVLTALTVLLVVIVLYIFGGEAVHGFAFALLVGVATGMYSSIYIASPILLWLIGTRKAKTAA